MPIKLRVSDDRIKLRNPTTVIYQSDGGQIYSGPYSVTPKVANDVVLQTRSKVMNNDVTVFKIPQFEISNDSGGKTLILGEEYYGN